MFTQFFINFSNTKSYGNCSALELSHADRLNYVPHGWERAWNRCVNSAFPLAASLHAEEVPKIEICLFLTSPWKWSTVPYYFSYPIRQPTLYQINKGHAKWYVRLRYSWLSKGGYKLVTLPRIVTPYRDKPVTLPRNQLLIRYRVTNFWYVTRARVPSTLSR
jgi:hypothetical protein